MIHSGAFLDQTDVPMRHQVNRIESAQSTISINKKDIEWESKVVDIVNQQLMYNTWKK